MWVRQNRYNEECDFYEVGILLYDGKPVRDKSFEQIGEKPITNEAAETQ